MAVIYCEVWYISRLVVCTNIANTLSVSHELFDYDCLTFLLLLFSSPDTAFSIRALYFHLHMIVKNTDNIWDAIMLYRLIRCYEVMVCGSIFEKRQSKVTVFCYYILLYVRTFMKGPSPRCITFMCKKNFSWGRRQVTVSGITDRGSRSDRNETLGIRLGNLELEQVLLDPRQGVNGSHGNIRNAPLCYLTGNGNIGVSGHRISLLSLKNLYKR